MKEHEQIIKMLYRIQENQQILEEHLIDIKGSQFSCLSGDPKMQKKIKVYKLI